MRRRFLLLLLAILAALAGPRGAPPALAQGAPASFTGIVRDHRSRPVPNAVVRIPAGQVLAATRTGADGGYTLPVRAGFYELLAQKPGYVSVRRDALSLQPGQTMTVDFRLEWASGTTGGIEALVVDNRGTPLAGAEVDLAQGGFGFARGTTDEVGSYVFVGLPPGVYVATARRAGYREVTARSTGVLAGSLSRVSITLPRDGTQVGRLGGTVLADGGQPLVGATVTLVNGLTRGSVKTTAGGRYELRGLTPGADYAVRAVATGYASQTLSNLTVDPLELTVANFTLVPNAPTRGSIAGQIRDPRGTPLPFATVTLTAGPGVGERVQAGAEGRYVFQDLPPGPGYALVAELSGYNPAGATSITVTAGRTAVVDLTLRPAVVAPGAFAGLVRDGVTGRPLGSVQVEVTAGPSTGLAALTDAAGAYRIPGVTPGGGYALRFTREGYQAATRSVLAVNPGVTTTVDVSLSERAVGAGRIAGTLTTFGGGPLVGVRVTLFAGVSQPLQATTGTDGKFAFPNLQPAANYGVRAERDGYVPQERSGIAVRGGEETRVDFALRRGTNTGTLRGQVVDLLFRPVQNARVIVLVGPSRPGEARTNTQGQFTFDGLTQGLYTLEASAVGLRTTLQRSISVSPGRVTNVTIVMLR